MALSFRPQKLSDLRSGVSFTTEAQGDILYRGATKWNNLAAGTSGQVLTSGGAGANPSWQDASAGVSLSDNNTWTGIQTFSNASTVFGAAGTAPTLSVPNATSGAGNDWTFQGSSAGSGNSDGGDFVFVPGALAGSGEDGSLILRQPGGTPGTNELQIRHNGTGVVFDNQHNASGIDYDFNLYTNAANSYFNINIGGTTVFLAGYLNGNNTVSLVNGVLTASQYGIGINSSMAFGAIGVYSASISGTFADYGNLNFLNDGNGGSTLRSACRTVSQFTANQDDLSVGNHRHYRMSTDASRDLTGIVANGDGCERYIYNVGSNNLVLKHESTSSAAANRLLCNTGADITLGANEVAMLVYDDTTDRWRVSKL